MKFISTMTAEVNRRLLLQKKILLLLLLYKRKREKSKGKYKKAFWIRQIFLERSEKGEFQNLVKDLRLFDSEYFFRNFRMTNVRFEQLLSWIAPYIFKSSDRRPSTSPAERLIITLRYLATGDAQFTISSSYRVSPTTTGRIILETTTVIWQELCKRGYMKSPSTENEWKDISRDFFQRWNFPNCLGCIDGKHVMIQAPNNSGSLYYNYKKYFSIVLLAVCDAQYRFLLVDIGRSGRNSDSGIYGSSQLGLSIEDNLLSYPDGRYPIPGYDQSVKFPYVFLADEGFAMKTFMMRPYPKNCGNRSEIVFNYRLSRARRVIENSFGILATRFRIFRRPIIAGVEKITAITKASVALHNYLITEENQRYIPENSELVSPEDVTGLQKVSAQGSNNSPMSAKKIRNQFKTYFSSPEGVVSWQNDMFNV